MRASTAAARDAETRLWAALAGVVDPEIPVLTVVDLGIVRYACCEDDGAVRVGVSPTYSGCPATEVIKADVARAIREAGFERATIVDVLSPPWSSDWISEAGRRKLREYGIVPPAEAVASVRRLVHAAPVVECPRCRSRATEKLSEFGSTPCKALYRCTTCREPFNYFKCI